MGRTDEILWKEYFYFTIEFPCCWLSVLCGIPHEDRKNNKGYQQSLMVISSMLLVTLENFLCLTGMACMALLAMTGHMQQQELLIVKHEHCVTHTSLLTPTFSPF